MHTDTILTPEQAVSMINKDYARLLSPHGIIYTGDCSGDAIKPIDPLRFISPSQLKMAYGYHKVQLSDGSMSTADRVWLGSSQKKIYSSVVLDPSAIKEDDSRFNLFKGFSYATNSNMKEEDIEDRCGLFLDRIFNVICAENNSYYAYLLNWLAYLAQKPHLLPKTAIIIKDPQGIYAEMLTRALTVLFTPHSIYIPHSLSKLIGKWNSHLRDKLLIIVAEIDDWSDKQSPTYNDIDLTAPRNVEARNRCRLREMITNDTVVINTTGLRPWVTPNYQHFVVTSTNNDWITRLPATQKADKEFVVFDVKPPTYRQEDFPGHDDWCDAQWSHHFSIESIYHHVSIRNQLEAGGYAAFMALLQNLDIDHFDPSCRPD